MRKSIRNVFMAAAAGVSMVALAACGGGDAGTTDTEESGAEGTDVDTSAECPADLSGLTVGFVAVGPEGGWRDANENNVQAAFKEAGADVKYAGTADNDQANQLQAFSSFVDEGVDIILLSATEATG